MRDPLDNFDTSYWHPKDSVWMAERERQWEAIAQLMVGLYKSKKALGIVQRYFYKGSLPDWEKLKGWDNTERHLDLMLFLYLHPNQDKDFLISLREAYVHSSHVIPDDICMGMHNLLRVGMLYSCSGGINLYSYDEAKKILPGLIGGLPQVEGGNVLVEVQTQGQNEQLFRLLFPSQEPFAAVHNAFNSYEAPRHKLLDIWTWSEWLTLELPLSSGAADMLYQYDYPLEFWYTQCGNDMQQFIRDVRLEAHVSMLLIALYRFQHFFDRNDEADPRAPFVRKFVDLIENRGFLPPVKLLWEEVKSGEVVVENIWTHDSKLKRSALWSAFKAKPKWDLV